MWPWPEAPKVAGKRDIFGIALPAAYECWGQVLGTRGYFAGSGPAAYGVGWFARVLSESTNSST